MKKLRILLLTANRANRRILEDFLSRDFEVISASHDDVFDIPFDMGILDAQSLTTFRKEVQSRRESAAPAFLPFLVFLPRANAPQVARFLKTHSVDDIILTPIDSTELIARVNNLLRLRTLSLELQERLVEVERLSVTDDVSGFHNTRFLHNYLDDLLAKKGAVVSLVFTDMDKFKSVVDTHGHLLGAKVLREAAEVFDEYLGKDDRIVRYGGDEYVLILPGQQKAEAYEKTETLRKGLMNARFLKDEKLNLSITASIGLATYPEDAATKRELLAAADKCLFYSKENGKNRVTVCQTSKS